MSSRYLIREINSDCFEVSSSDRVMALVKVCTRLQADAFDPAEFLSFSSSVKSFNLIEMNKRQDAHLYLSNEAVDCPVTCREGLII